MTTPPIATTPTVGSPDAILLVLGCSLGTGAGLWERALPHLTGSRRVSIWELPGHGTAAPAAQAFSVGDLADAVADAYDEPFDYAGVSIGGAVALELAARHPSRVRTVAAICSGARLGTPAGWHERAAQVRSSGTSSLVTASAERWFAPGTIAAEPEHVGLLLHALRDTDDESYARCCEALASFDARPLLAQIAVPVLAAWGEHDAVTPQDLSEEIAGGAPRGRTARIAGASHLAPVDRPERTAQAVLDFLTATEGE